MEKRTSIKEILSTVLKKVLLLQQMEEKEDSELIEVEVGILYDSLFIGLIMDIMQHKEELYSFLDFVEAKANVESNPYELRKVNELLEAKKIIEAFDLELIVPPEELKIIKQEI